MNTVSPSGCSGHCTCAETVPVAGDVWINGVSLYAGPRPPEDELRERAWTELLRQQAVRLGYLLAPAGAPLTQAPTLSEAERTAIERMLDAEVPTPPASDEECRRYHAANKADFTVGQAVRLRHILFAVTPGVNVHALMLRAEAALLELLRPGQQPGRFAELAAELSNCPSGAQGGELGWVSPTDCTPELSNELFTQKDSLGGQGLHPRLVHSRHGFHILDVRERRKGRQPDFEQVLPAIRTRLLTHARTTALRHYMQRLVGQAECVGVTLEGAASPLLQ